MTEVPAFDMVIFGGSGDLAMRKLFPALYHCHWDRVMPEQARIFGVALDDWTREEFLAKVEESCRKYIPEKNFTEADWAGYVARLDYYRVDAENAADYEVLAAKLRDGQDRVRVFFLSTAPSLFTAICDNLASAGLITPLTRVVLEKPLGHNLASSHKINDQVGSVFQENQIYRIDHYLGKEPVQNLMALRFGNTLFEPMWRRAWIRDMQITVAEKVGVEGRGAFYEQTGALRDMVQNHMLQLLCILAMPPPFSIGPDAVRDEKLKVLRALQPITGHDVALKTVRGQYKAGAIEGGPVPGYLDEPGIAPDSTTETFVALKVEIDNWRWAGVPFFLRTGKRLPERLSEIVVNFRGVPHSIFDTPQAAMEVNHLVIRLHPDEGVQVYLMAKVPGKEMRLRPVSLSLNFAETFKLRQIDAYERLMMDTVCGNLTLFVRRDELDAAWTWIDPILEAWKTLGGRPKGYTAGTWGPAAATAMIGRDDLTWYEES